MADRVYEYFSNIQNERIRELISHIGNTLNISGFLLGNEKKCIAFLLPVSQDHKQVDEIIRPSVSEWQAILEQSDDPTIFAADASGVLKPFARKVKYAISGDVQHKIWARDNFSCWYCGKKMGEVTMSVDHIVAVEISKNSKPDNLLSACRRCNKRKGNTSTEEYCQSIGKSYQDLLDYVKEANKKLPK